MENVQAKQKMTFKERLQNIGPTAIIAGAIIGPGTVSTCTLIGIEFQYALLWVCLLLIFFQIALRDMTTRLALGAGKTFQNAIREDIENKQIRNIIIGVVLVAIVLACLSFIFGNLTGAGLGLQFFVPSAEVGTLSVIIGVITGILILTGSYKTIEKAIKYMVMAFGLSFLFTSIISSPNWGEVFKGLLVPSFPEGSWPRILSLIGTSGIGGYTLFLHANAIKEKWSGSQDISKARNDIIIMVPVAMITTMMIMISAASMHGTGIEVTSAATMGTQFEPLYGPIAKYIFAIGLFCAGVSSSIPLTMAVAWIVTELLGLKSSIDSTPYRVVSVAFLVVGSIMAYLGVRPVQLIVSAQMVNGVLGPITSAILLFLVNKKSLMKKYTNPVIVNVVGIVAVVFAVIISTRSIMSLF